MNTRSLYAFYGSLRRGMNNYEVFKKGMVYMYSTRLQGFQLFSLGDYPCAVFTGNTLHTLTVEVFKVTDPQTEKDIHELEIGAGYFYTDIEIANQPVGIYLYRAAENYQEVSSGDWVEFFRKKGFF